MTPPNDRRGLFSRLPDDPEYWQLLTDRIVEKGAPHLAQLAAVEPEWWSGIARFSSVLAAGAVAAVAAFFLLMPAADREVTGLRNTDAFGLVPTDPLAVTLVSRDTPPSMETLIAVRNAEPER